MGEPPTLSELLARRAAERPRQDLLRMAGRTLTYGEFDAQASRLAAGILAAGIGPGETVAVMLPNCPEFALLWLALGRAGIVAAPVNTAFRGDGLRHLLDLCGARMLVIDEAFGPALEEVRGGLARLERVVTRSELAAGGLAREQRGPFAPVDPAVPAHIFFTSGTTGRSKACLFDSRYAVLQAGIFVREYGIREDDVLYNPFPLFHIDASVFNLAPAIVRGCTAALGERFSASRFWEEIRAFQATVFDFMGATLTMLWKAPERLDDGDNPVRLAWGVPMPDFAEGFEERFRLRLVEGYGLTDAGVCAYQPVEEPRRPGYCGRVVPEYEVTIAGDGEILLRPQRPGLVMREYLGMPAETAAAFAGGWFHTGDLGRLDGDGWLGWRGRKKDSIRRRGENISAYEIEEVIEAHPAVLEAAAFGVPSELTEEDVMVCVALRGGARMEPRELERWCQGRMARHMVPRYIEFVDGLPRTPTEKVEKHLLKSRGVTARTWDGEG